MTQSPAPNAPARSTPRAVGVIGLGAMGMGVARSLLRKGFGVHACDVREAARQSIASEGAIAHATPAALAARVAELTRRVAELEEDRDAESRAALAAAGGD